MQVLQIDSVLHSYGSHKVLRDVFLKCRTGEVIGILGKNGSGKTTFLEVVFGNLKADSSAVHLNGNYIENCLKETRIVYLPQISFLPRQLTVKQCISLYIDQKFRKEELYREERIGSLLGQYIGNLSGGERRYLEIFLILALDSDFVLLDEPFSELEPIYKTHIKAAIRSQLADKCFLLTDHDYTNIIELSSRLFLLRGGILKELEDAHQLISNGYLPGRAGLGV